MSEEARRKIRNDKKPSGRPQPLDPDAWLERHGDALYSFALLRVRDPILAEDMVQEALLAALEARARFSGESSERTWLIAILKRKIVDHLRKCSRETALQDIDLSQDSTQVFFSKRGMWKLRPSQWAVDPATRLERREFWEAVSRCVSDLPSRLADAFMLREMDGMECKEICKVLHVSATNLWVMLHRARLRLRHCLEKNWIGSKAKEV